MGRPDGDMGRPGGGGMGRPVSEETGGRGRESSPSLGVGVEGRLGRIVVGPSEEGRAGALGRTGGVARGERTVLFGASSGRVLTSGRGVGASEVTGVGAAWGSTGAELFVSCEPDRRRPSASALRRIRSA